jgi:polar amino acid transport system permease protein
VRQLLEQFLSWDNIRGSLPLVLQGFVVNLRMMLVAEAAVLAWALVLALLRVAPGSWAAPLRWLSVAYVDFFRGVPLLLVFFLVGFGLPQTSLPGFAGMSLFTLSVISLTLVYGAYVAEVYRAGIQSVHPSQVAAGRSLGLSYAKTMRFVVLPQAVRRVVPPLLNDFVGLQKDTALAGVIGVLDGFRQASIYAGNTFNVSSLVGLSLCFVLITVPLARLTDWLLRRDAARMQAATR